MTNQKLTKQQHAARERAAHKKGWTPVRYGDAYCSPFCGGGPSVCSIKNYERAVDISNKVAKDLGPGWTTRLNENLGWHCSVTSPCRRIRISLPTLPRDSDYTAFLGPVDEHDMCCGKWAESGRTPREAIENVLNAAKRDLGLDHGRDRRARSAGAARSGSAAVGGSRAVATAAVKVCGRTGCPKCGRKGAKASR